MTANIKILTTGGTIASTGDDGGASPTTRGEVDMSVCSNAWDIETAFSLNLYRHAEKPLGMLITLEGLDGSGKSSCHEMLQAVDFPREVVFTREPTTTWYGEAVQRSIEDDDADPLAELFLYVADHAAHISETVEPALDRGAVVISDRYSDSRYAYQGATLSERFEDSLQFVREIRFFHGNLREGSGRLLECFPAHGRLKAEHPI
mgnify:CR=1 FL=1